MGKTAISPAPAKAEEWGLDMTGNWDAWYRLVEVKDGATVVARYEYDGLARRVRKHLDSDSPNGIDAYLHYDYNGAWQTLETRRSTSAGAQVRDVPAPVPVRLVAAVHRRAGAARARTPTPTVCATTTGFATWEMRISTSPPGSIRLVMRWMATSTAPTAC